MKEYIYPSIFLAFLFLLTSSVGAQSLWNGTKYGMSVKQVKVIFPDAVSPLKPESMDCCGKALLALNDFTLVDKQFSVSFFFKADALQLVQLSLVKANNYSNSKSVFDSLVEVLRSKYGKEIKYDDSKSSYGNIIQATWMSGRTNISLSLVSVGKDLAYVNVSYGASVAKEADKL
jgi:hypothetical protein